MKIKFEKETSAIKEFDDVDIGDNKLIVLTGLNGSGKTKILESISNGNVKIEGIEYIFSDVKSFSYSNFHLTNNGGYSNDDRKKTIHSINDQLHNLKTTILNIKNDKNENIYKYCQDKKINELSEGFIDLYNEIGVDQNILIEYINRINYQIGINHIINENIHIIRKFNGSILDIGYTEIDNIYNIEAKPNGILLTNISELIKTYQIKEEKAINKHYNKEYKRGGNARFDQNEFIKNNGENPVNILNSILDILLDNVYKVDFDDEKSIDEKYKFQLENKITGDIVELGELSSGEKILLGLATSIYISDIDKDNTKMPKILLLDELDATLHPGMIVKLLDIIKEEFIEKHDILVIMATHSPTTISIVEEDSIYEVKKGSESKKIEKISQEEALSMLTEGFLVVKKHTKHVLVEGTRDDQKFYETIYRKCIEEGFLDKKIGINFISAGKNNPGEGSCTHIIKTCEAANQYNPKPIFMGILDGDNKSEEETHNKSYIFKLERYSMENYFCDPILIFSILLQNGYNDAKFKVLEKRLRITNKNQYQINDLDNTNLQLIIDYICSELGINNKTESIDIEYINGKKIQISKEFIEYRGHDLSAKIKHKRSRNGCIDNNFILNLEKLPGFIDKKLVEIMYNIQNTVTLV